MGSKLAACKNCIFSSIFPYKFVVSRVIITELEADFSCNSTLYKNKSVYVNFKFIRVTVIYSYIYKLAELIY